MTAIEVGHRRLLSLLMVTNILAKVTKASARRFKGRPLKWAKEEKRKAFITTLMQNNQKWITPQRNMVSHTHHPY